MNTKTSKLTFSAMVIALYIIVMYFTQSIAFGQYQLRLATGLYSLSYSFPFLCFPLGFANMFSNVLLGGDIVNGFMGFLAGVFTTKSICLLKKITTRKRIIVLPSAILPSLIIPIWLSFVLRVSYYVLFVSLLVGQTIAAYTVGIAMIKVGERLRIKWPI